MSTAFSITPQDQYDILAIGEDLPQVWHADTTTPADRKHLLRLVVKEVLLDQKRLRGKVWLQINWQTGASTIHEIRRHAVSYREHSEGDQVEARIRHWLLLDSRVVGFAEVVPPNCCHFSSLKPFFFNGPKKELCFSDNAWSINRFSSTLLYTARETQAVPGRGEDPHFYIFCSFTERTPLSVPAQLSSAQCLRAG